MRDALALLVRTQLRRRWGTYLALVLVVAASGAVALASIAGARRTASAFERYLDQSRASQLAVNLDRLDPSVQAQLEALPGVIGVQSYANVLLDALEGALPADIGTGAAIDPIVSVDGRFVHQDRAAVVRGRLPDLTRADEALVDVSFAASTGLDVGDRLPISVFSPVTYEPIGEEELTIVGVGVTADDVAPDDIDDLQRIVLTPAFLTAHPGAVDPTPGSASFWWAGLRLAPGADVATVEAAWDARNAAEGLAPARYRRSSTLHATVQRAIRPQVVTLAAFGAFAAVLALALTAQVTWRTLRAGRPDAGVLRTLGAGPRLATAGPAIAAGSAVVVGALVAVAGAVALSPLAPIGVVGDVEPRPGVVADLVALAPGFALLVATGVAVALVGGARVLRPLRRPVASRHRLQGPLPVALGVRAAFGRRSTAGRSAVTAAIAATIAVVATLAYTSDLRHLTRTPRLYGADFDAALQMGSGYSLFDPVRLDRFLAERETGVVTGWSSLTNGIVHVGDLVVPAFGLDPGRGTAAPAIERGRPPSAPTDIVLGEDTLARTGAEIGDLVDVEGVPHAIVGTAVLPALGQATGDHPTLATGAWMTGDGLRRAIPDDILVTGAAAVLLDTAPGVDHDDLVALARRMEALPAAWGLTNIDDADVAGVVAVLAPPQPGELVGIAPDVAAPWLMAGLLGGGAMVALGIALVGSVRSRRRDLAVLKAIGFTRRQLSLMIETQAVVTVLAGAVIGIPLGVALGSTVWRRFADDLGVLAETRVPVAAIALGFAAGLGAALAFTALPGRAAARTPAALTLRSE